MVLSFDLTGIRMLSWISAENTILIVLFSALVIKMTEELQRFENLICRLIHLYNWIHNTWNEQ